MGKVHRCWLSAPNPSACSLFGNNGSAILQQQNSLLLVIFTLGLTAEGTGEDTKARAFPIPEINVLTMYCSMLRPSY